MSRFPENQLELLLDVKAVTLSRISDNLNIVKKNIILGKFKQKQTQESIFEMNLRLTLTEFVALGI